MPEGHVNSVPTVLHPLNTDTVMVVPTVASCDLRRSVLGSARGLQHLLWVGPRLRVGGGWGVR